ncbi:MAG TPA: Rpn family recombination-promoting nuclease/putative transposase, partial [Candidimonas sp.]|nr:Rpn family recombination-promoting nuclease/putative transposase [Candidimonas sp.]
MNQHDASYRQLFSSPHMVRCLFDGILQACTDYGPGLPGANDLDWDAAQALPTSYIGKGLQQRHSDCVWRIPRRDGDDLYILLLLEHQSRIDAYMALRILIYVGLLYQSLLKQGLIPAGGRYPPVLPVVLYSGVTPWSAATHLRDCIDTSLALRHLQSDINYILLDEGQMLRTSR